MNRRLRELTMRALITRAEEVGGKVVFAITAIPTPGGDVAMQMTADLDEDKIIPLLEEILNKLKAEVQ